MAVCQFSRVGQYEYAIHTFRAGIQWTDGELIRTAPRRWLWVMPSSDSLGPWPSEDKAKIAISNFIETWGG